MGLPELRAFLADAELVRLLDEQLAIPADNLEGYQPTLRQAIALVLDDSYDGAMSFTFETALGPWIEGFNAIRAADSRFYQFRTKHIAARLVRPSGLAPLVQLSSQSNARVRAEAFAALTHFDPSPAFLDVMVRGVTDSSSKVRAIALSMLRRAPELAVAKLSAVPAKGKAKKLIDEAIAMLVPEPAVATAMTPDSTLLDELVAIWNATHQPEVADLIDTAATQLPSEPLAGRSAAELEARWHAIAKAAAPATLGSLLATPWPTKWRDGMSRLSLLNEWHDPRIASALCGLLEAPPYHSKAALAFFFEVLVMLATIPDARQQKRLEALRPRLEKQLRGYFHNARIKHAVDGSGLAATLAAYPPKPYGAHAAAVERARAELVTAASVATSTTRTHADLLAEIYANPESDTARLVYADFLTEHGDPRGELIVLQCAAQRTDEAARRELALISHHDDQLVGPLGPYIQKKGRRYERGFLASCVCEPRAFSRGAHEPAWATVRQITFTRGAPRELAGVLLSPRGAAVRVLRGLEMDDAEALASDRVEEISYRVYRMAHATHPKLPNLRRLGLSISTYDRAPETELVAGPLWPRLERLAINDGFARLPLWIDRLAKAPRLTELVIYSDYCAALDTEPDDWTVTITRGPKLRLELHSSDPNRSPLEAIAQLGPVELEIAESRSLAGRPDLAAPLNALALRFQKSASGTQR